MSERLARPSPEAAAPRVGVPLQTRGAVQPGALYVARRVDEALRAALRAGRWAVVLGPRFSGKSSLRVRTVQALQHQTPAVGEDAPAGVYRCATIEARSLPAASSGAVYLALCTAVAAELRLPAVTGFWQRYREEPPAQRFRRYLLQEVVTAEARTVLFCDDFEALQTLPVALPELLAALGQVQQTLAADGNAGLLTVVFFSAVSPERLATPADRALGAAQRFLLADFTRAELAAFGPALAALVRAAEPAFVDSWLDAVFAWTAGHPQLTQRLCQQLVARAPASGGAAGGAPSDPGGEPAQRVERLVHTLFLADSGASEDAIDQDPCLREIAQALTRSPQASALLALYRRLLSGVPVTPDPLDALQQALRLCGLAAEADDAAGTPRLRPRGRLVTTVLGESWAREHEVRLVLQEAIARESAQADRAPTALTTPPAGALLRGVPLKNAQAWARKHPEALRPPEVRVLLASLEAARSEAEAKHQASAAALQRERRDKTEIRPLSGPTPPALSANGYPRAPRSWARAAAIGLSLCLIGAALASAHRRASRFEHAAREAATRAVQAEQALLTLQRKQPAPTPEHPASAPPEHAASAAPQHAASVAPQHAATAAPQHAAGTAPHYAASAAPGQAAGVVPQHPPDATPKHAAILPRTVAPRRVSALPRTPADRRKITAAGKPKARELGYCPDPARATD